MSFNLSRFRAQVKDWLRPYSYEVIIQPPGASSVGGRQITLRTEAVTLPGGTFMTVDNFKPYGSGLVLNIPYAQNVQEITCTHTVDSKGEMFQRFYDWMDSIADVNDDRNFTAGYYYDYVRTMQILLYDLKGRRVREYELLEAFPMAVSQTPMSWASAQEVTKIEVTYRYRNHVIK